MSMSGRERFWDIVRDYRPYLRLLLAFATTLLVLTLLSIGLGDQRTDSYVISLVTAAVLLATIVPAAYCLWRCGRVANEFETGE